MMKDSMMAHSAARQRTLHNSAAMVIAAAVGMAGATAGKAQTSAQTSAQTNAPAKPIPMKTGTGTGRPEALAAPAPDATDAFGIMAVNPRPTNVKATQPPAAGGRSLDMTTNLVRLMVKRKLITETEAQELFAEAEADTARAAAAAAAASASASAGKVAPPPPEGVQRVPYVSPSVRAAIRDEVKADVMAEAKAEGWAAPKQIKDWMKRITITGDFRLRSRSEFFDSGNTPGAILDVNEFNATGPFDINLSTNPIPFPTLDSTEDRLNRLQVRARLFLTADLNDHLRLGMRLATGNNNSPISTNTTLGGEFNKKDIWLDLAFVDYAPIPELDVTFGRMINPFQNPARLIVAEGTLPPSNNFQSMDLLFDPDLNFDGINVRVSKDDLFDGQLGLTLNAGAFPLDYSANSFPNNSDVKVPDRNKWLYAAELVGAWRPSKGVTAKLGVGYFSFQNVQGVLSSPCATYLGVQQCDTDQSRPSFSQTGNTVFPIRQIAADNADPNFVVTPIPQFLGLSLKYDVLYLRSDVTIAVNDRLNAYAEAEFVKNTSYRASDACRFGVSPFTNIEPGSTGGANPEPISNLCAAAPVGGTPARLAGGDTGWQLRGTISTRKLQKLGDWAFTAGYRYLEADAVLDAFTDSDFGLGTTNTQGYFLFGTLALDRGINLQTRYFSSREIAGPNYAVDLLFIDVNVNF